MDIKEIAELLNCLKQLPADKQKEFRLIIKGAALVSRNEG